jgi:hypothetical protein
VTTLTARCNAIQLRSQLYSTAVADEDAYKNVPLDTLRSLIVEGLKEDTHVKKVYAALGLLSGEGSKYSVLDLLLNHYQAHSSEQ